MVAAVTVALVLSPDGCCCYCNVSVESMGLINGWVHVTWPVLGLHLAQRWLDADCSIYL